MKLKVKLDKERLQQLALAHGEKVGLALAGLLFCWLAYSALQVSGYSETPEKMAGVAASAKTHVEGLPWVPADHKIMLPNPDYGTQVANAMQPVESAKFHLAAPWNIPLRDLRVRRDEPKYLPPRDLKVAYDFGAVGQRKGDPYSGYKWVAVTALVPYGDQLAEYHKLFDNALHKEPALDTPAYNTYVIERAEVRAADQDEKSLVWTKLDIDAAYDLAENIFLDKKPDYVAKKFVDPVITEPCPPLVGKTPSAAVAHPPEIEYGVQVNEVANAPVAAPPVDGGAKKKRPSGAQPAAPVANAAPAPGAAAAKAAAEVVPYKLFRFFDYTVEHEKSYRYRVRLILNNPNKGVVRRFLKTPQLAEGDTRETDWSAPSDRVTIPRDNYILAGSGTSTLTLAVTQPSTLSKDPVAGVLLVRWVPKFGVDVSKFFKVERGAMLDFPNIGAQVPVAGKPETKSGSVDFLTSSLLVDMYGGDLGRNAKGKPIKSRGEFLVMGPDGALEIHQATVDGVRFDQEYRDAGGGGAGIGGAMNDAPAEPGDAPAGNDLNDLLKLPPGKKK